MHFRRVTASLWLCLLAAGCGGGPVLSGVSVEPAVISPNHDGTADVARIGYRIGAAALLSIDMVAEDGTTHPFRASLPRAPGPHEALFGGVIDGRMLADGLYVVRITAIERGADPLDTVVEERNLEIRDGDSEAPILAGLSVHPDTFTPNQDGIGDRVAISYRLDEPATVRLWLETVDGSYVTDILEEEDTAETPGDVGPHTYDFDAGVDADAPPPPDGEYYVVAEARDAVGNVTTEKLPLRIRDGGQPRAAIVGDVEWSDTILPLGSTLRFTTTVVNIGDTPLRTRGPEPGFRYDNTANFNQPAWPGWLIWARHSEHTVSRALRHEGALTYTLDIDLGHDRGLEPWPDPEATALAGGDAGAGLLEPGHTTDEAGPSKVCGQVTLGSRPVAGARVVAFESDGDNGVETETDADGRYCIGGLRVPEAARRTYARSSGAIRLGLEYDDRESDVEYPFRWQVGRTAELEVCSTSDAVYLCLPPGASVRVTGSVRFVAAPFRRTTHAYLALMHEDVRNMQGPYDRRLLTVEY